MMGILAENRDLQGVSVGDRFLSRVPIDSNRRGSIERSIKRLNQCNTTINAFNINTITESKSTPLPKLLLSQYFSTKNYCTNVTYAKVIESELDKIGKLDDLHKAIEKRTGKKWDDIKGNISFYSKHLYAATCEIAPDVFSNVEEVKKALEDANKGELININMLVDLILDDIEKITKEKKQPQRYIWVLDEVGQWVESDKSKLSQLQALMNYSAIKGQGKIWIIVTTHRDMGTIFKEAMKLDADMKTIEARFRVRPSLTTENINIVLEERLFKKKIEGRRELEKIYDQHSGVLRNIGELANTSQTMPPTNKEKFSIYYPYFPYQVHLIPEIVKSLRSKGGHGEQMTGSTRTLIGITQDVLRDGRRSYLDKPIGPVVSFDEIYHNLAGEGEINPDVKTDISKIIDVVPNATDYTRKVAEVLYLIKELDYIPRTRDNISRFLVEDVEQDFAELNNSIQEELERLIKAKLVARIGEEYEFLTGERRSFEEEIARIESEYRQSDRESGFWKNFVYESGKSHWRSWFETDTISYKAKEFSIKLLVDENVVQGTSGHVTVKFYTPLITTGGVEPSDLESKSLLPDEKYTIYFCSGKVSAFYNELSRFLAMKEVIENWKGNPHKSEESRKLAQERENNDLPKLERKVIDLLREGIKNGLIIFRGSSRKIVPSSGQNIFDAFRSEISHYWPQIYSKFERMSHRVVNDQRAIIDVLSGRPNSDVKALSLYDSASNLNMNSPIIDGIKMFLVKEQNDGRRITGKDLVGNFDEPPYGWDGNAIRVGTCAMTRGGLIKILINKKPYTNPEDQELIDTLRVSKNFMKCELVFEETDLTPEVLTDVRKFLMDITRKRNIDETPSALGEESERVRIELLSIADKIKLWSDGAEMKLPDEFINGLSEWESLGDLNNPAHKVNHINSSFDVLRNGYDKIKLFDNYIKKHGSQYKDISNFVKNIDKISYLFNKDSSINQLLRDFKSSLEDGSFIEKETWKQLVSLKKRAEIEIEEFIKSRKDEEMKRANDRSNNLPKEIDSLGLKSDIINEIKESKIEPFLSEISGVNDPIVASSLSNRVDLLMRSIDEMLDVEFNKLNPDQIPERKKTVKIRIIDYAGKIRIKDVKQWEEIRDKADREVKKQLSEGNEVELN